MDSAGVGEDEMARGHEVVEVEHFQRIDDVQPVEPVELGVRGRANLRVHVDGIDRLGIGVLLHHAADSAEHAVHGLAQVLAAMRRDEDEAAAGSPLKLGVRVALAHGGAQRVDAGVAGDPDLGLRLALVEQVSLRLLGRREVVLAHDIDGLAVELLGPGAVDVVRAKPRLHVAYRDLQVEARERCRKARGGVAVNEHHVGLLTLQHRLELQQHIAGDVEQGLARFHDGQVVVRHDAEHTQHLVEHLPVLACDRHDHVEVAGTRLQLVDERTHLDGLRARAEDEHHFLQ